MNKWLGMAMVTVFLAGNAAYAQAPLPSGKVENGVRVIEVKASKYKFDPDPIVVKKGEQVRLVITATDVAHGLSIPEFNVNVSVEPGTPGVAEFSADKAGEFTARCSVYCGPGHMQMQAKVISLSSD